MIRINLAKRKGLSTAGGGGGLFGSLDIGQWFKSLTAKKSDAAGSNTGGSDASEKKKFDLRGPLPMLAIGIVALYSLDDMINSDHQEKLQRVQVAMDKVQAEIATNEQRMTKLRGYESVKKQLEDDEKSIRIKLEVLRKVLEDRDVPAKMLIQVANVIPNELWLTDLNVSDESAEFSGATPGHAQVSEFIRSLGTTSYFGEIALSSIQESTSEQKDQRVQTFQLKAARRVRE